LTSPEGAIATLQVDQRVKADSELIQEICKLCGENTVELEARG
jgi:hypothetical protein